MAKHTTHPALDAFDETVTATGKRAAKKTTKRNTSYTKFVPKIQKRDGAIVPFDFDKIVQAIYKGMLTVGEGSEEEAAMVAHKVMAAVVKIAKKYKNFLPTVEGVQDEVERELILSDYVTTAKHYILYRQERAKLRREGRMVSDEVRRLSEESRKYLRDNSLSEFVYYTAYARWDDAKGRRETWVETVDRYMDFMKENLEKKLSSKEYDEVREAVLKQDVCPSMRLLWSAGPAARNSNVCAYNCSFIAPTRLRDFGEIMYISMCGTGVGFSVESEFVEQLPQIKRQIDKPAKTYVIEDSKEGWSDALVHGLETWFDGRDVTFDYSRLRPAGARLKTMGGRSSGPEPLRGILDFVRKKVLARQGKRLRTIDVHDITCKIGEGVVAGGVRRSALISLSDLDDMDLRDAKKGQFYLTEPQRSLANNSAVYTEKPTAEYFLEEWTALVKSQSGERGIFNAAGFDAQLPDRRVTYLTNRYGDDLSRAPVRTNPCVTGDTLVYVADGRGHVPIKQLADEGKDVPVFCFDKRDSVTVRTMRNPRVTGHKKQVYRVTLDDGSTIKATENHRFRMRTGEYKEVKELTHGDSLAIATKYEAPVGPHKRPTNEYWWINNGVFGTSMSEHRVIASHHYNRDIPKGYVVHHKDMNSQNNAPENLEIMSKEAHDELHARLMRGDANPMRRAQTEWSEEQWRAYRKIHSENNSGEKNKRYSGIFDDELREHALRLTGRLGRRFSMKNWIAYAKEEGIPQSLSKWRRDHLGDIRGFAKWAANECGLEHVDADPRVQAAYARYTKEGYDCSVVSGCLRITKRCEVCGTAFDVPAARREYGMCSVSCGVKNTWRDPERRGNKILRINAAHTKRKEALRLKQADVYNDVRFSLGRTPLKAEWVEACKKAGISNEISRESSPFRSYRLLEERADMVNHKVLKVEFCGFEDVYNGTVDEFHNFFVGGFAGFTATLRRKFVYLNNRNCGEIFLQNRQFCNLTSIVARADDTPKSLERKMEIATLLGTYQSALTNFSYLSSDWKKNCEDERLLGVSITGYYDNDAIRDEKVLKQLRTVGWRVNKKYAKRFGINESTCITCVKPHGNSSQLLDTASGMHPRFAKYYVRRVRVSRTDPVFQMLKDQGVPAFPEVGQSEQEAYTFVLEFPVKAPNGAVVRNDVSALEMLEEWFKLKKGFTEHNPSVTIYIGPDEWIKVANFLYENWDYIGGLSFLPRNDHVYKLAPYEEIGKDEYEKRLARMKNVDFGKLVTYESADNTTGAKELACVGGTCEVE